MDIILLSAALAYFFYQNLMSLLFLLFLLSISVSFHLSYSSSWASFLFIMVYIGGVLVLAIYTILSSSNWKFPPFSGYLLSAFPPLNMLGDKVSYSFFEGLLLSVNMSFVFLLLVLLLLGLLLLVKLVKF